jgi:phosphoglycerate dehydrogenase-like enzyme
MQTFKVLMADPPSPTYLQWMRDLLPESLDLIAPETPDDEALLDLVKEVDFLVCRRRVIGREVIQAGKKLKLIQTFGMTRGNVDLSAAKEAGIPVAGMPLAGCMVVADLAMTFLLALSKNLLRAHQATVNAEYQSLGLEPKLTSERSHAFQWMQIPMVEVFVKTLGIVGLGEIGTEMAKRARAFKMMVLYHKRHRLPEEAERELGIEYRSLEDLLRESDFVSLNVPHTEGTDKLIGQQELALMKPSAFLINTSRGGVVDEDALYKALASKAIAGAGLDVFREEPLPASSPLLKLDNVILTPHIGGGSGEPNLYKEIRDVLANVARFARGEEPQYILQQEKR